MKQNNDLITIGRDEFYIEDLINLNTQIEDFNKGGFMCEYSKIKSITIGNGSTYTINQLKQIVI